MAGRGRWGSEEWGIRGWDVGEEGDGRELGEEN